MKMGQATYIATVICCFIAYILFGYFLVDYFYQADGLESGFRIRLALDFLWSLILLMILYLRVERLKYWICCVLVVLINFITSDSFSHVVLDEGSAVFTFMSLIRINTSLILDMILLILLVWAAKSTKANSSLSD